MQAPTLPASVEHLRDRVAFLQERVQAAVARRRERDPNPDDPFRGLYISEAQVDELLSSASAPWVLEEDSRLRRLERSFGLDPLDAELLLVALAPDLDPRLERLYGYLHDDVTRRRASVGLALELCRAGTGDPIARDRFRADGPLVGGGLLVVEESDRPFLTRSLRVPDRVLGFLLGSDAADPLVAAAALACVQADLPGVGGLAKAFSNGTRISYVRERPGAAGFSLAATALSRAGWTHLAIDLRHVETPEEACALASAAVREARLRCAALIAGPLESLVERSLPAVRTLAEAPCPVIVVGTRGWDSAWSRAVPLLIDAPVPSAGERGAVWRYALDGHLPQGLDPDSATVQFRLAPEQIVRAAQAACMTASGEERQVVETDLRAGARAQNAAGLERLARRIQPKVFWEDLVLPPDPLTQLHELAGRTRLRDLVLDEWGMGKRTSKGRGVTALFAGDSGTGKTMAAEVIAGELGLDVYLIDLSTVVDKYVGETEKNLERIFVEADRVSGVLLFDEADAIFGKRSEVKDAHDRYANVEIAYLLQRMETFDGLAILTTNLRANVDEAFIRRLDLVVDFPMPDVAHRRKLWELNLRPELPRGDDIDLDFLAEAFDLSGGNIRNIVLTASFFAADESGVVDMTRLIRATEREYRKLGRMCVSEEFGPYFELLYGELPG